MSSLKFFQRLELEMNKHINILPLRAMQISWKKNKSTMEEKDDIADIS